MNMTLSGLQSLERLYQILYEARNVPGSMWSITGCTTIVEAHVDRVINSLITASEASVTLLGSAMLAEYRIDFTRTWNDRFAWLDKGFGIEVKGATETQDMYTAIDLRNAIAHGNMRLTDIQVGNLAHMTDTKRRLWRVLEVHCNGRNIVLSQHTVERVVKVCVKFVRFFDSRVTITYPQLDV